MASTLISAPDAGPPGFVRIDDLARLMDRPRAAQHWAIWMGLAAVLALQIAGPKGLAGGAVLPGPAWLYPFLALAGLAIAISIRLGAERDLLAMEINSLKLRALRDAAAAPTAKLPDQTAAGG